MKIVHIDAGLEWRGGQKQVFLLHKGLLERGVESFLVCNNHGELYHQTHTQLANTMGWKFSGKRSSKTKKDLKTILEHIQPDVIHFHDSLSLNYSSLGDAYKIETRRVSYPIKWISRITKHRHIHLHVGVSQTITHYLKKYFKNCHTIHSSIDVDYYVNGLKKDILKNKSDYNILFVGAYSPQKGIPVLLKAFSDLIKTNSTAKLHLCGSGEMQGEVNKLIQKLAITDHVMQYGHQKDIAPFYYEADVIVVPSVDGEGSSGTIKEGIACLKTVIASDIAPNKELIEHGKTGFLFESGNSEALATLLKKNLLLSTHELESKRLTFSSSVMVESYISLYQSVVK